MFFIKVFQKLLIRYKLWKYNKIRLDPYAFNRKQCEEITTLIYPVWFRNISSGSVMPVEILTNFKDLNECVNKLDFIIKVIHNGEIVPAKLVGEEYKILPLNQILTVDGFYTDVEYLVFNYREKTLRLCKLLEGCDSAEVGLAEHNKRILTKLITNLYNLSNEIVKVSI